MSSDGLTAGRSTKGFRPTRERIANVEPRGRGAFDAEGAGFATLTGRGTAGYDAHTEVMRRDIEPKGRPEVEAAPDGPGGKP